jgi:hypothetical protein
VFIDKIVWILKYLKIPLYAFFYVYFRSFFSFITAQSHTCVAAMTIMCAKLVRFLFIRRSFADEGNVGKKKLLQEKEKKREYMHTIHLFVHVVNVIHHYFQDTVIILLDRKYFWITHCIVLYLRWNWFKANNTLIQSKNK